jgi:hypothetical protein
MAEKLDRLLDERVRAFPQPEVPLQRQTRAPDAAVASPVLAGAASPALDNAPGSNRRLSARPVGLTDWLGWLAAFLACLLACLWQ